MEKPWPGRYPLSAEPTYRPFCNALLHEPFIYQTILLAAVGEISDNAYFAVKSEDALGLPAAAGVGA